MSDRRAAPAGAALVLVPPAIAHGGDDRRALAALVDGAALVQRRYGPGRGGDAVPAMAVLNVLRELDLLLGLAIGEAAVAWGVAVPRLGGAVGDRLAMLGAAYPADVRERDALHRIDARRRALVRERRAASAGAGEESGAGMGALLAAAARAHAGVAAKLAVDARSVKAAA